MSSGELKYCPDCCQNVTIKPGFNLMALIVLLLFGIIPGIIYWALTREKRCPICHAPLERLQAPKETFEDCASCSRHRHE